MSRRQTVPEGRQGVEASRHEEGRRDEQARVQAVHGAHAADTAAQLAHVADLLSQAAEITARIAEDQLASQPDPSVMGDVQSAIDLFPGQARFLTVRDLAEVMRVNQRTVRRWRQQGDLPPALEVGGVVRWRPEVIDAWILEQESER